MGSFYTETQRALQDRFGTRRLADAQERVIVHDALTDDEVAFVESRDMVFLSTVDEEGVPTVSYKGGDPGFLRVEAGAILLPWYDGNGMFLSLGNAAAEAKVGLLFIDFEGARRLRVHGAATLEDTERPGAQLVMRIRPFRIFVNCPRYIHHYKKVEASRYVPDSAGHAPVAQWKRIDFIKDDLPEADRARVGEVGTITMDEYERRVAERRG